MRRSLFLVVILITLASLYPWRLRERPLGSDPLTLRLRSWPSGVLEVAQLFVWSRVGSALDMMLNAVGAAVGVSAARAFEHVCRR